MAIDTTGEWWKGSEASDIAEYLKAATAEAYPVDETRTVRCHCGGDSFLLEGDCVEATVIRTCAACGSTHEICGEGGYTDEAEPETFACGVCREAQVNVCVGFSLYAEKDCIRWLYIGVRCCNCWNLGIIGDWKIGYGPSLHLMDAV